MTKTATAEEKFEVTLKTIKEAQKRINPHVKKTPIQFNSWLSKIYDCEMHFKLENMHPIGSFKIRGATNMILSLTEEQRKRGVVAASAGNHAQGVAWGARISKTDALVFMPEGAPILKIQNTESLGAKVQIHGSNYDEAAMEAKRVAEETGRTYVPACDHEDVLCGQGTVGLEILEQLPDVEVVVGAVGGGGLMAGTAVAIKSQKSSIKVYGCQASGVNPIARRFNIEKSGGVYKETQVVGIPTFADGIAVSKPADRVVDLLRKNLDGVYSIQDRDIAAAVLALMEKAKIVSEGAGAVPLAVVDLYRNAFKGKKVCLIVGGGNIDVNVLSRIIDVGLIQGGRRIRVNVLISDRPGSLYQLTKLIADHGASIIQAIHDRNQPAVHIDETMVALTLETKGPDHSRVVLEALKDHVIDFRIPSQ